MYDFSNFAMRGPISVKLRQLIFRALCFTDRRLPESIRSELKKAVHEKSLSNR